MLLLQNLQCLNEVDQEMVFINNMQIPINVRLLVELQQTNVYSFDKFRKELS